MEKTINTVSLSEFNICRDVLYQLCTVLKKVGCNNRRGLKRKSKKNGSVNLLAIGNKLNETMTISFIGSRHLPEKS